VEIHVHLLVQIIVQTVAYQRAAERAVSDVWVVAAAVAPMHVQGIVVIIVLEDVIQHVIRHVRTLQNQHLAVTVPIIHLIRIARLVQRLVTKPAQIFVSILAVVIVGNHVQPIAIHHVVLTVCVVVELLIHFPVLDA